MTRRRETTPEFLTVADAVQTFGLGRTLLFSLMAAGRLQRYKVGTRTLVRAADLRALIEASAVAARVGPNVGPDGKNVIKSK